MGHSSSSIPLGKFRFTLEGLSPSCTGGATQRLSVMNTSSSTQDSKWAKVERIMLSVISEFGLIPLAVPEGKHGWTPLDYDPNQLAFDDPERERYQKITARLETLHRALRLELSHNFAHFLTAVKERWKQLDHGLLLWAVMHRPNRKFLMRLADTPLVEKPCKRVAPGQEAPRVPTPFEGRPHKAKVRKGKVQPTPSQTGKPNKLPEGVVLLNTPWSPNEIFDGRVSELRRVYKGE